MTTMIRVIVLASMVSTVLTVRFYFYIEGQPFNDKAAKAGDIFINVGSYDFKTAEKQCNDHRGHLMDLDSQEKLKTVKNCLAFLKDKKKRTLGVWTKAKAVSGSWKWNSGNNVAKEDWCRPMPASKPGERVVLSTKADASKTCYVQFSEDKFENGALCEYN